MKMLLEFDHRKATQAINYLIKREGGKIDKLKLIKLVYLADRYHLRKYGRPIVNDTYYAMPYGPVGSSVKDIAEFSVFLDNAEREYATQYLAPNTNEHIIAAIEEGDTKVFSKSELEALDFAYSEFGAKKPLELVKVAHRYPEWAKFKSALESKETTREPMSYSDFFQNPADGLVQQDEFKLSNDVLDASREVFEESYQIAEYWK